MKNYTTTSSSRYSFSNAHLVYNEEGIQIHKEEYFVPRQKEKGEDFQEARDEESSK